MRTRQTPIKWRKDWQLYRARSGTDSRGNPVRTYDMDSPDFTGTAGTVSGVCWQLSGSNAQTEEMGDRYNLTASFVLYLDALEIAEFDRCSFGGALWEVRKVLQWPNHRQVELVEVKKL